MQIVLFCKKIDTTIRLTGRRVKRERLDLARTTYYRYSDLAGWLRSRRFHLVWHQNFKSVGLFLLRPE